MEVIIAGKEKCYDAQQCRDARIRYTEHQGLKALRLIVKLRWAWPGGYEMFGVTTDSSIICACCLRKEYDSFYRSTRDKAQDGYAIETVDAECNIDGKTYCDICDRPFGIDE